MSVFKTKSGLLATCALMIVAGATPSLAQEAGATAAEQDPGDIVVTARRTEERLQDVPISITVYNQQQLANRNIVIAADLATYTPSLSLNQRFGPEKSSFAIRGFNQEISTAPTVGVYFADVVGLRANGATTSGNTVSAGSFMDLQNLQVLKGPQGTLFGRNTTGGAVLLVPRKPTDQLEGYVEGSLGNYDQKRLQGALNIPLADTFRVRLAVDRNSRDGYLRNHSGIGPDSYNNVDYLAARLSVVADLTPDLENYAIFQYNHSFSRGQANRIIACDPAVNFANFARAVGQLAGCAQLNRQTARGDSLLDVDVNALDPKLDIQEWRVINTTTWKASDTLTVKNIASYGEFRENAKFTLWGDNFVVPAGVPNYGAAAGRPFQLTFFQPANGQDTTSQSTFTEELQLQGETADKRLTWVLGGYLEMSRPIGWNSSISSAFLDCSSPASLNCGNPLSGVGGFTAMRTQYSFDNNGVFAQGSFKATERLTLTAGLRYTFDKTVATSESTRFGFNAGTGGFDQFCGDITRFFVRDALGNPVLVNGRRASLPASSPAQCHNEITEKSNRPTWLVSLDYKPVDNVLLYAKYSRGYRQGGINLTNYGLETWRPETVDAYEVGAKLSFRGAVSGYFNVAAFYNSLRGQQIFGSLISKDVTVTTGGAGIVNAGKSRMQGVELDTSISPFKGLRLDAGYTYLDTKVIDLTAPTLPADSPFLQFSPNTVKGNVLTFSPKHRLTATATYQLPLADEFGDLSLGATFTHTSSQLADLDTPIFGIVPATDLLNLNVNWDRALNGPIDLAFFATNVTNEKYVAGVGSGWKAFGFANVQVGQPRIWGFRARYRFGGR